MNKNKCGHIITYSVFVLLLLLSLCWGGHNYIEYEACLQRQVFAEKTAKKDSIKAKQADNRLINVARPDSIKVNPVTGQTILYISTNSISNNPVTNIEQTLPDTTFLFTQATQRAEKKYIADALKQDEIIAQKDNIIATLNARIDSIISNPFQYADKYLSLAEVKNPKPGAKPDSITRLYTGVLIPIYTYKGRGRGFVGLPVWDTNQIKKEKDLTVLSFMSPDPYFRFSNGESMYSVGLRPKKFGGALSATANYNGNTKAFSFGPGLRIFKKNGNGYIAWYYNVTEGRWQRFPTISLSKNIFTF